MLYIYISHKTLRSLWPEIGEFASRAGEDRATEDRAGQESAGQGDRAKAAEHSRAGRGQKAGQGMMLIGIVLYE